jgi:hypothetical protein
MPVCIGTLGAGLKHPSAYETRDIPPGSIPSRPPRHRLCLGAPGACRGRSSNAQSVEDGLHSLPFSIWCARTNATSHVTLSHEDHVFIPRARHSKLGMRWRPKAPESLRDRVAIWIDSRLISCQSFLSPIVPSVPVAAYLGLEYVGTLTVDKVAWPRDVRVIRPKPPITS